VVFFYGDERVAIYMHSANEICTYLNIKELVTLLLKLQIVLNF